MKTTGVSQISVTTTPEAEEPVAALLETIFGEPASAYTDVERGSSTITVYIRATPAALRKRAPEVEAGLKSLGDVGLDTAAAEILIRRVPREDWAESWKKHFKTIQVGSALMIKPSWSKRKPREGQRVVVLDPGLSFGTGQHATTSFCLKELVQFRKDGTAQAMLDAGCGSGILAISAAKLGYSPVTGFDFDPVAVRIANKNCRSNRVDHRVQITRKDLTKMPEGSRLKADLICANLVADLLIGQRRKLINRLQPAGLLVLAGILETQFAEVRAAFEKEGFGLVKTAVEREWQSGSFARLQR